MTSLSSHTAINKCKKNRATKHSVNTARTQHQQKQDKDYESQHKEQQPHYNERRATGRDRLIHIPGQYNQQTWRHSRRHQSKDTESKSCIHHVEKNLRAKQIKTNTQNENIQFKCQGSFTLWIGDMAKYKKTLKRIQTFINKCLRRILHLKWTDKISNTTLWKMTKQLPIENEIKKRKMRWIGQHRKPPNTITRQAITWNPPGKRRRGRPRNTWQRDTEKETKEMGYTRREMEKMATDRKRWRSLVDGLCSQRAITHK
ncbi:hypothetical protein NP493_335g01042 [Ridgeia piscesae]|uniref:Uncharacterized protein n=1 Tax=Ridgeia piscesae TaxID=27915 RepID=A0AAD9NWA5_RIDPI|nr:hypothetical protein NP493_335g01042 [Ridgeia piscesae]